MHADATSYDLSYTCEHCKATTLVTAAGLRPPRELRPESAERYAIDETILVNQAKDYLRFATCPHCNARNTEGAVAARAEDRSSSRISVGFFLALALVSYFFPFVAWAVPLMSLALTIPRFVMRRRAGLVVTPGAVASNIALVIVLGALVVVLPRFAFVVPALLGVWLFVAAKASTEGRFADAAEHLRFHGVGYRDPPRS